MEDAGPVFEGRRYSRGLLWAWEVAMNGPLAAKAEALIASHVRAVLRDLRDPAALIAERAADELYLLGQRGFQALESDLGDAAASRDRDRFLLGLLRWRIRPRTYAQIGIDFAGYEDLPFRARRRKVLDYARVARNESIPTLRAIVNDDKLEKSFFVKLAAAKALLGLKDSTGYAVLVAKYPEITVAKPEFSLELRIIQGYEHIREKEYQRAVEEFRKVLDEEPFHFQANYHIAFAYLLLKDYPRSIHHFEIARRINRNDQLTLYNLACAYALSGGNTAAALDALEASVEAGFDDHEHMENDPDLESLRQEERYRQLIERLKSGGR
jgi:tetratricopeptide (TPR) repeat protein